LLKKLRVLMKTREPEALFVPGAEALCGLARFRYYCPDRGRFEFEISH